MWDNLAGLLSFEEARRLGLGADGDTEALRRLEITEPASLSDGEKQE